MVLAAENLVEQTAHDVNVFVTNLDENAARLRKQVAGDGEAITQVGEIGIDAVFPCVTEGLDLFDLAGDVLGFAICNVALISCRLPVTVELNLMP